MREELISTAVKFLENDKVRQSALLQAKVFLNKKGLSEDEVNEALRRSGVSDEKSATKPAIFDSVSFANHLSSDVVDQNSNWVKFRNCVYVVVGVGSTFYALYHLYKNFITAWFSSNSGKQKRARKNDDETSLTLSVDGIRSDLDEIKNKFLHYSADVEKSIESAETVQTDLRLYQKSILDIKDDIHSIKSLLLSKNQFPSIPVSIPTIPSWQLQSALHTTELSKNSINASAAESSFHDSEVNASDLVQDSDDTNSVSL